MKYNDKQEDRRKFTRIPFKSHVYLHNLIDDRFFDLLDISLKGVLLKVPIDWLAKKGDQFILEIPIGETTLIRMEISLAYRRGEKAGFYWHYIDERSFVHLRQLMEKNIGNAELLESELSALQKFQKHHDN